jgi:hypothetical protein
MGSVRRSDAASRHAPLCPPDWVWIELALFYPKTRLSASPLDSVGGDDLIRRGKAAATGNSALNLTLAN